MPVWRILRRYSNSLVMQVLLQTFGQTKNTHLSTKGGHLCAAQINSLIHVPWLKIIPFPIMILNIHRCIQYGCSTVCDVRVAELFFYDFTGRWTHFRMNWDYVIKLNNYPTYLKSVCLCCHMFFLTNRMSSHKQIIVLSHHGVHVHARSHKPRRSGERR